MRRYNLLVGLSYRMTEQHDGPYVLHSDANARIAELETDLSAAYADHATALNAANARADAAERALSQECRLALSESDRARAAESEAAALRAEVHSSENIYSRMLHAERARADAAEQDLLKSQSVTAREIDRCGRAESEAAGLRAEVERLRSREGGIDQLDAQIGELRAEVDERRKIDLQNCKLIDSLRAEVGRTERTPARKRELQALASLAEARVLLDEIMTTPAAAQIPLRLHGRVHGWLYANPKVKS